MFTFASPIDSGESKRIQNLIWDKIQGIQPNPSNLKTQWDKTRACVGVSTKGGVRCQMFIFSLMIDLCITMDPLVFTSVIIKSPYFLLLV